MDDSNLGSGISADQARRKAAVDYARGSVRLEGFVLSSFAEDLYHRYVIGEISGTELTAAILAHHSPRNDSPSSKAASEADLVSNRLRELYETCR